MLLESIKMSWNNIIHNKMRSFLTILGIMIGVASIIALITIVSGATSSIQSKISSLGANKIMVQVSGTPLKTGLSEQDLADLQKIGNVSGISPTVSSQTSVVYGGVVKTGVSVQGRNEVYFDNTDDLLQSGRGIDPLDVESAGQVAVIGSDIVKTLFYGTDPLGKSLLVNGCSYKIVGVLAASQKYSQTSTDDSVIIPYSTAMRELGTGYVNSVDVYISDESKSDEVIASIKSVLNAAFNYHDDTYTLFNMQDIINTIGDITGMMSLLLAGIASISLVVGGIGIMNMMLVSVTERTTEIGLRKALGAEPASIQLQFLIESIFISLLGGFVGMLLGLAISLAASAVIGISFVFSWSTVFLAAGFSTAVGIVFGLAPARKASRLNPIDALRSV